MKVEVVNVDAGFGDKKILENVNLVFEENTYVILGANGSGKSTLLRTIAGLLKPLKGRILINGVDLKNYSRRELSKLIGYCWQNPYYGFFEESVEDEIRFILDNLKVEGRWEIVELLNISDLLKRSPFKLSGGEAKRVSLASVLIADQPIILLDEPFTDLDYSSTLSLLDLLWEERRRGKTVIVATHNIVIARKLRPEKYILIKKGRVSSFKPCELDDNLLSKANIVPEVWWHG